MPKKNSKQESVTRAEKGAPKRTERARERVPMGLSGNLYISPKILEWAEENGKVLRWGLDDDKGKMEKYAAADYVPYIDAETGNQERRPAGTGRYHILMMLDEKLREEDMALKRERNNAILAAKAKLESGEGFKEYIPDDREYVVARDL